MIVLITGATAGFGLAIARVFVAEGARVIATGRRQERLDALVAELGADKVLPLRFDVQDRQATLAALASIPEAWSAVDVLVNNAGLALGWSRRRPRTWMTGTRWWTPTSRAC